MKLIKKLCFVGLGLVIFLGLNLALNYSSASSTSISLQIAQKKKPQPASSKKMSCFEVFSQADDLYLANKKPEAETLYRKCKPEFGPEVAKPTTKVDPVYDIAELPQAERLWNQALDGIEKKLDTKIYYNLLGVLTNYPQFVPAYMKMADYCLEKPKDCKESAQPGQPKDAGEILERITQVYPDNPDLLKKKLEIYDKEKKYIEASIAARQFATIYDDYPEAPEFKKLADDYLKKFEDDLDEKLTGPTVLAMLANIGTVVLTGDPNQAINGVQLMVLLQKGEKELGKETSLAYANKYEQAGKIVQNKQVLDYIEGIAGRITPYMGRDFEYEYHVVEDDSLNAFALPGGKVFVNTGAILKTNSEAELAGLLGHEISHAALSHGFQKLTQSAMLTNLGQVLPVAQGITQLAQAQNSQEAERQADILGTRVLASAGYAADGLYNLMNTLAKIHGNNQGSYLSSHPAPKERVAYLQKLIVDNNYDRYRFEGVKKHKEIQEIILKQKA